MNTDAGMNRLTTQLVWNRLLSIVEEQAQTLMRTAFSTVVREAGDLSAGVEDRDEAARRRNNTAVLSVPEERVSALMLASSEGKIRLAVVAGDRDPAPSGDQGAPGGDGDQALAAAEEAEQKPFYFDDFFPEREKPAPAAAPKPSPGQRVQVFEGAESRSTYVQ